MLQAVDLLSRISLLSEAEFAAWTVAHADEVEATVDSLKSILTDQSDLPSTPPPTTAEPSSMRHIRNPKTSVVFHCSICSAPRRKDTPRRFPKDC